MKRSGIYIKALRLPFISASLITALIALCWAKIYGETFNWINAILALSGVAFLHLGANTINDYFDTDNTDTINLYPTPFSGGSRVVVEKLMTKREILALSLICFFLAGISGLILFLRERPLVLLLGFLGFFFGWFYSSKPVQFMRKGLGELIIFLAFGPFITLGTGYAIEGKVSLPYFLIGLPMGFIVTNILWINEFPDYDADSKAGKNNLVVRLGLKRARWGYVLLMFFFYASIILLIALKLYPLSTFLSFLTIPLVLKSVKNLWKNFENPPALVPSQALTIKTQALGGILICAGILFIKILH